MIRDFSLRLHLLLELLYGECDERMRQKIKCFTNIKFHHHENRPATQNNFPKDIVNQVSSFEELGIPFKEVEGNLTAFHTNDVMDEEIVWTVRAVRQLG